MAIDVASGTVTETIALPGAMLPNDVAVGADGAVYVTDMLAGGVYRLSRNPQLVGGLLLLSGVSLLGGTAAGLGLTLGFGLLHHPYLVRVEEPHLRRVFGDPYRRYCGSVSRYLGVRPRRNRG